MEEKAAEESSQLIGVDVLVRPSLRKSALRLLAGAPAAAIHVCVIVFAQVTRPFLRRHRLDKAALIATAESLLSRAGPAVDGRSAVRAALQWYRRGTADFVDDLGAVNREAGTAPTHVFDKQAASSPALVQVS